MWLSAIKLAVSAGSKIYANKQRTKMAMSDAQLMHASRMAEGKEAYQGKLLEARQSDWKDEADRSHEQRTQTRSCIRPIHRSWRHQEQNPRAIQGRRLQHQAMAPSHEPESSLAREGAPRRRSKRTTRSPKTRRVGPGKSIQSDLMSSLCG